MESFVLFTMASFGSEMISKSQEVTQDTRMLLFSFKKDKE